MVRGNNGIARVEKSIADGPQVGHSLGIIAEPGASIDVDNYRITVLLLLRIVDVQGMVGLVIGSIIHISDFL